MFRFFQTILLLSVCAESAAGQYTIAAGPSYSTIYDDVYGRGHPVVTVGVGVLGANPTAKVKFKAQAHYNSTTPDFLVVSPSSGVTPQTVSVGVNPRMVSTLSPGTIEASVFFTTLDQTPQTTTQVFITLVLGGGDPPIVSSVVNAASLQATLSPGAVVSILGKNLGPPVLSSDYDDGGVFPTHFGLTTVTFNGIVAPLLYVSPGEIDAIVPRAIAGQQAAQVVISHYSQDSKPFSVPVADVSPAIFSKSLNGHGNGILNYSYPDYILNAPDNPVEAGRMIVLFATGVGVYATEFQDGAISLSGRPFDAAPISLTIAGIPATIYYAGAASYEPTGIVQLNAYVPGNVPSGNQPVVLKVGQADNSQQNVTIAVK